MWRALLLLLLFVPQLVWATDTSDLNVTTDTALSGKVSFKNIHITVGTTLTLLAGTDLTLQPGGSVSGEGKLQVLGTALLPVVMEGPTWTTIDLSGGVEVTWLTIIGALGPFFFRGPSVAVDHLRLTDVPRSEIYVNATRAVLQNITMLWDSVPLSQRQVAVYFIHTVSIELSSITFPRKVDSGTHQLVDVSGGYQSFTYSHLATVDGCGLQGSGVQFSSWDLFVDGSCVPPEPSLLFVPGYGASLNPSVLANAQPGAIAHDSWSLIPFLTSSYTYFFSDVAARGVKYNVAYYDWRQSLATIVRDYLVPAIDALKQRDHIPKVYLVAHSFGGLVARAYIQSPDYRDDVAGLVELGTPNQGSVKAYAPWEGGVYPSDWAAVSNVVRGYAYQAGNMDEVTALRTFIPSGRALLPTGPVLQRGSSIATPLREEVNQEVVDLNQSAYLLRDRLSLLLTVAGTGETTTTALRVGEAHHHAHLWPDGEVLPNGELSLSVGDGTVSVLSASLPRVSQLLVAAAHQDIPGVAADMVLELLYPTHTKKPNPPLQGAARTTANILWFVFDCPVTVAITTPSGGIVTSDSGVTPTSASYVTPEAIWMLMPQEPGNYKLAVTALAPTEVRWWQGTGLVHTLVLEQGQVAQASYAPGLEVSDVPVPIITVPPESSTTSLFPSSAFSFSANLFIQAGTLSPLTWARVQQATPVPSKEHRPEPHKMPYALFLVPMLLLAKKFGLRRPLRHPP